MGEHQPLPVPVQHVLGAGGGQLQAAPPGERLQQQVNLGIVAQGLVVAHALHRGGDGLPVDDAAGAEGDRQAEALGRQRLENLQLNLPMSWMWISRSRSFHTRWSWGSSSSSRRSLPRAAWGSCPSGRSTW